MENDEMKQVEQRVKRYWYADGIAELTSGCLFVLLGIYFGAQGFLGRGLDSGHYLADQLDAGDGRWDFWCALDG